MALSVISAKAGIQYGFLDTGACPGLDPGSAGMTNPQPETENASQKLKCPMLNVQ